MTTFADLRDANVRRNKEWVQGEPLTLTFRATELAGESGEACNAIKKIERERLGMKGSRATMEDLAEELADTVICCDLIAMDTGIDLAAAIERKFDASSVKNGLETRFARVPALEVKLVESIHHPDEDPLAGPEIRFSASVDPGTIGFVSQFRSQISLKTIGPGDKVDGLAAATAQRIGLIYIDHCDGDGNAFAALTTLGMSVWRAINSFRRPAHRVRNSQSA